MWYALYHFIKLYRRKILNLYYSEPKPGEKYIYFPFHVPLDVQLTVRCPEFFAQESVVEQIAKAVPPDYMLYIKRASCCNWRTFFKKAEEAACLR